MVQIRNKLRMGDILKKEKIVTEEQILKALPIAKESHKKLGEVLVELGYTTEDAIASALSRQLDIDVISLTGITIEEDVLKLVNVGILRRHLMIPFEFDENNINVVRVAMADPMDMIAVDDFSIITDCQVEPLIATPYDILLALDKYYGDSETMMAAQQYAKERELNKKEENEEYKEDINTSPIVQLVKSMIEQAARQRASDIHIEALENTVRVRFRIDGALYERMTYDIALLAGIVARLKILGGMDISEKRKPQDGRITIMIDRKEYDIRVSVLPTVFGEKCVMRIAQKKALTKDKKELGFSDYEMAQFDHILANPNGMILVTGPTGSGKSTTLYTALSELNRGEVNIITVEDPVEANIDGVNQIQVNPKADLTFATALRSILRQDPDIIMIGEIRDSETASIAIQASITGHLVVSTLHTNSAAGTLTRMLDMGIESYLLADSMKGVIAQRLVRCLCPDCKKKKHASKEEKQQLGVKQEEITEIYEAKGCPKCNQTGFIGRTGVYEVMQITPQLRLMISRREDTDKLKEVAIAEGMNTLSMSAARLVLAGKIPITEMLRVSFDS